MLKNVLFLGFCSLIEEKMEKLNMEKLILISVKDCYQAPGKKFGS